MIRIPYHTGEELDRTETCGLRRAQVSHVYPQKAMLSAARLTVNHDAV
jgi:hypothetical protein